MEQVEYISNLIMKLGVVPLFVVAVTYLLRVNKGLIKELRQSNKEYNLLLKEHHQDTLSREKKVVTLLTEIKELLRDTKIMNNL